MNAQNPPADQRDRSERALPTLVTLILVGLLSIVIYALQCVLQPGRMVAAATVGIVAAGASLMIGGLLGFLFGIPRTSPTEAPTPPQGSTLGAPAPGAPEVDYKPNANLEQISDWLTKILVGVGLTQLTKVPEVLRGIADYLGPGLQPGGGTVPDAARVFAVVIVLYFVVSGFLLSYLWTRLFFTRALRQAEREQLAALSSQVTKIAGRVDEISKRARADARALSLVYRQLNPGPEAAPVPQEELNAALQAASMPTRVQVFYQARQLREDGRREGNVSKMEPAIPVFRALIAADTEGRFHRNHAQIGYALKDKYNLLTDRTRASEAEAILSDASNELSKAIEIRDRQRETDWLMYEFSRAFCQVELEHLRRDDRPSAPEVRERILQDLRVAIADEDAKQEILRADSPLLRWMQRNHVQPADLTSTPVLHP